MKYDVRLTDQTRCAILEQATYIAVDCQSPLNAQRWLDSVMDAIDSLSRWPRRFALAAENESVSYEVRRVVVGECLILFSPDDDRQIVLIIGFRHGGALPSIEELPEDLPQLPPDESPED